jgi:hypothetical protein
MATTTATIALGRINPQPVSIAAGGVMDLYCDPRDVDKAQSGHTMYLSSSDTTVARVQASVKGHAPVPLSAIAPGTCTITATAADSGVTTTLAVTVT